MNISVVIPVYNMALYLKECLDSIESQTLDGIEIIAVDDGSTDESLTILQGYQKKYENIKIFIQANKGAGAARNNGIQQAKGKYLAFMDPDDFYPNNDCLKILYEAAEQNHVSMCGGLVLQNFNGIRTLLDRKDLSNFYNNNIVNTKDYIDIYWFQRFLYRREMIQDNDILFPTYRRFEDPPFLIKALVCAGSFFGIDEEVYVYRVGHKQIEYTLEICKDIIDGIRDTFQLSKRNNLIKIYENRLYNIYEEYTIPFFKYAFCGNNEIDKAIEGINDIAEEWDGINKGMNLSKEKVLQNKVDAKNEYDKLVGILCNSSKKVFYGAGVKAHRLIKHFRNNMNNVIGIAVTKKQADVEGSIEGLPIRQIEEYLPYSGEALMVIATSSAFHEEIKKHLRQIGFCNILVPDMKKIELAEQCME